MPPKPKISKEDVLQAAFLLVRGNGADSLNARNIARALHCSTQPIFSYYSNMADLKSDVFMMANRYHSEYFNKVETDENIFLNVGMAYIDFALEEPNLFRLLFMSDGFFGRKLGEFVGDGCNEHIAGGIPSWIDRDSAEANRMFTDMWLYAHGVACMLAANQLSMERKEIEGMVRNMFLLLTGGNKGGN